MKKTQVLIEDFPAALAEAVERDAVERDLNRNDVVCDILSRRFHVPFKPSGYPLTTSAGFSTNRNIRLSVELRDAIRDEARSRGLSQRGLIVSTLQIHYDLPTDSPRRRRNYPSLEPDLIQEARARYEAGESMRSLSRRFEVNRETLTRAVKAAA